MGWLIKCNDSQCSRVTWSENIVDLICNHRDSNGWLLCECGSHGHIEKNFQLQEPGETWEPYLRAVIPLGNAGDTYQPFVFLVSYKPTGPVNDVWFSYYKDLRATGGRLKLGYGPGGPPVLGTSDVLILVRNLQEMGCVTREEVISSLSP